MDGSGDYSELSFGWIPGVLRQLSSRIQRLAFEVTATSYLQFDSIPWASIDNILDPQTPQFRDLTRVEVLVRRGFCQKSTPSIIGKDIVCLEIMRRLPTVNRLGLLRCYTE